MVAHMAMSINYDEQKIHFFSNTDIETGICMQPNFVEPEILIAKPQN